MKPKGIPVIAHTGCSKAVNAPGSCRQVVYFCSVSPPTFSQSFPSGNVAYHLEGAPADLRHLAPPAETVIVTDENVWAAHRHLFAGYEAIVLPAGEDTKSPETISLLAQKCLELGLDRKGTIVGLGGGVVTDITGFLAAVYLRGVRLGLCPTTILAAADAAVGGKNGVNLGPHKNILGTIRQPDFILLMPQLFSTLPAAEWSSGFAEVLKCGAIADRALWAELSKRDLNYYRADETACATLLARCIRIKNGIVAADETEQGQRKLLNFGHTAGHAIERLCNLSHGAAVAIGMHFAAQLSVAVVGLDAAFPQKVCTILAQYGLPAKHSFDAEAAIALLQSDKKRRGRTIDFILLEAPGKALIKALPIDFVASQLRLFAHES